MPSDLNFKPLVDGSVLPGFPSDLFREGRFSKVPVMLGVVEDEWARSMGWFFRDLDAESIGEPVVVSFGIKYKYIFPVNAIMSDKFELIMSTNCRFLGTYICQAWDRRTDNMYNR